MCVSVRARVCVVGARVNPCDDGEEEAEAEATLCV